MRNVDTCVCCGEYVPEGRQVCKTCEGLTRIYEHYGHDNQYMKLIEECGELIHAIARFEMGKGIMSQVLEEIVDVKVLIMQIEILNPIARSTIKELVEYKVDRELKRIAGK